MWLGNKKRNDRRKSRREGSPFVRSKVTSKPRSPGFIIHRPAERSTIAGTRANIVNARSTITTTFFSWLGAWSEHDRNNATLRNNMDAGKFLAVTVHDSPTTYTLPSNANASRFFRSDWKYPFRMYERASRRENTTAHNSSFTTIDRTKSQLSARRGEIRS